MSIPPWFGFSDNRWTKPPGKTQCRRYSVEEGRLGLRTPSTSTKTRGVGNSMASKVREPSRQSPRLHAGCEHSLGVAKGCGARYLLALSICLPIIAPPQVRGREIFLDGSLLDHLPVKAMAEMGGGRKRAGLEGRGRWRDGPTARRCQAYETIARLGCRDSVRRSRGYCCL